MEKGLAPLYRPTSDASSVYREQSGLDWLPSLGSADCGNLAAITANSTFLVSQTVYVAPALPVSVRSSESVTTLQAAPSEDGNHDKA